MGQSSGAGVGVRGQRCAGDVVAAARREAVRVLAGGGAGRARPAPQEHHDAEQQDPRREHEQDGRVERRAHQQERRRQVAQRRPSSGGAAPRRGPGSWSRSCRCPLHGRRRRTPARTRTAASARATSGGGSGRWRTPSAGRPPPPPRCRRRACRRRARPTPGAASACSSGEEPGMAPMSVRVVLMCHRKATPANGTTYRPAVTSTLPLVCGRSRRRRCRGAETGRLPHQHEGRDEQRGEDEPGHRADPRVHDDLRSWASPPRNRRAGAGAVAGVPGRRGRVAGGPGRCWCGHDALLGRRSRPCPFPGR